MTETAGDFTAPGMPRTDAEREQLEQPDLEVGTDSADLDDLRAELTELPAQTPDDADPYAGDDFVTIPIETRPGYAIVCRLDFTGRDLDRWRKAAKSKAFEDGLDGIKFAALLLGATGVALLRRGKRVRHEGEPIDYPLQHRPFMATVGGRDVDDVVRRFFVREGLVDATARRVTTEAGWGAEVYTTGPTI